MNCPNCNMLLQGRPSVCPYCAAPIAAANAMVAPAVPNRESLSDTGITVADRLAAIRDHYNILPNKPSNNKDEHSLAALMFQEKKDKVAVIKTESGVGTGFFLPNGMIGTNAHVIAAEENTPAKTIQAIHMDQVYDMKVYNVDFEQDIAILQFNGRGPANIDKYINHLGFSHDLLPGDVLISMGNSKGWGITFNAFTVKDQVKYQKFLHPFNEVILLNGCAQNGNSGGPLINRKGEVVGLMTCSPMGLQDVHIILPEGVISAMLAMGEIGICAGVTIETLMGLL